MFFFMLINSAPTIILSIDNSIDSTILLGLGEEEEKEDIKLLLDVASEEIEDLSLEYLIMGDVAYTSKKYLRPHLNLVSPPPKLRLI